MKAPTTSRFHSSISFASRQRSARRMSMSSSSRSMRVGRVGMRFTIRRGPDGTAARLVTMGTIHFGPARVPSRKSPEEAVELLLQRGYSACEIDFEGGFWMDYPWAEHFGELARDNKIVLSVHAPLAGFMGHVERDKKQRMAIGMLDHSAGVAVAAGAKLCVIHPGFLLGRTKKDAVKSVVEQLAGLRERLEAKGRAVPFGVEVMGRVRDLGSADD